MICAWDRWRVAWLEGGEIGKIKNPTRVESGLAGFGRRMFFIFAGRALIYEHVTIAKPSSAMRGRRLL
jgi:hypothetical protein